MIKHNLQLKFGKFRFLTGIGTGWLLFISCQVLADSQFPTLFPFMDEFSNQHGLISEVKKSEPGAVASVAVENGVLSPETAQYPKPEEKLEIKAPETGYEPLDDDLAGPPKPSQSVYVDQNFQQLNANYVTELQKRDLVLQDSREVYRKQLKASGKLPKKVFRPFTNKLTSKDFAFNDGSNAQRTNAGNYPSTTVITRESMNKMLGK